MANMQPSFVSPSPSFDLNDFTIEASNPNFFGMGVYSNPFVVNDMPMDLSTFPDTFSWVCVPVFDCIS